MRVTIQVLEGLERGELYVDLETPITIGREDENDIRLNDERVSRFHAKIQDDSGNAILTDLTSTNGTRVNGHPVQMHVLRIGDQLHIGRCILVFGSPDELDQRVEELAELEDGDVDQTMTVSPSGDSDPDMPGDLFPGEPPHPPSGLTPLQRAQLADLMAFVHSNFTNIMLRASATGDADDDHQMVIPKSAWLRLQKLQMQLAETLNRVNEP